MDISIERWVKRIGMPLVTTDDRLFCFLIDTGASYNVLLKEAYLRCQSYFRKLGKQDFLLGMVGEPQKIFMVEGAISIQGKEYKSEFGVMEGTDAMNNVKILTGMQIDGALGVEFLAQYGITIDFKTYKLRCDDPK